MDPGFGHAAVLHDGEQDVQVAKSDPPPNPSFPVQSFCH
jgi:hypothetical protein